MNAASVPPAASGADAPAPPDPPLLHMHCADDDPYGWVGYESAQPHVWAAHSTVAEASAAPPAGER